MKLTHSLFAGVLTAGMLLSATAAQAHFLWLFQKPEEAGKPVVHAHFSDEADHPETQFTKHLEGLQAWYRPQEGDTQPLTVTKGEETYQIALPDGNNPRHPGIVLSEKTWGVSGRGDTTFLLEYYSKFYTGPISAAAKLGPTKELKLDVVPKIEGQTLTVSVTWEGKPVADSEVTLKGPGHPGAKHKTNDKGEISVELVEGGLMEVRARHIEAKSGTYNGKDYPEIRHYCVVAFDWQQDK